MNYYSKIFTEIEQIYKKIKNKISLKTKLENKNICDICNEICIPKKWYLQNNYKDNTDYNNSEQYCVFETINLNNNKIKLTSIHRERYFDINDIYDDKPSFKCNYKK